MSNVFENKTSKNFVDLRNDSKKSEDMFKVIFRNGVDKLESSKEILKKSYFTNENLDKWNKEFLDIKDNYLKKNNAFTKEEINEIKNNNNKYEVANSIGKIKVTGLKIKFKKNNYTYNHILPDFELYSTYCVADDLKNKQQELLADFTLNCLLKKFQNFYGINISSDKDKYPDFNANNDYLFNVSDEIKKHYYKKIILKLLISNLVIVNDPQLLHYYFMF